MFAKFHLIFVLFNAYLGFRPCVQTVVKDWGTLASAAYGTVKKPRNVPHCTLIIL